MDYSTILSEDIASVINDNSITWKNLKDRCVLITGATGMIGRACVRILGELNKQKHYNIKIYALGRNTEKGKTLEQIQGVTFVAQNIKDDFNILEKVDYIIHCAAVTQSSEMLSNPVGLIETEIFGSKNVLDFAHSNNVKGFVYTSSMESYGILDSIDVKETDQGYIDLSNPRNSYPMCKRMIETLCNCYWSQYQLPTKIVRLGMVFGAGEDFQKDNRVWAQFTKCACEKKSILLHTTGESLRSFVYLSDAIRGIFLILLSATAGETYNIATCSYKINEFAQNIANKFNLEVYINPPANLEKLGYVSEFKLPLNAEKLLHLGWKPQITQIENMVERVVNEYKQV